MRAGGASGSKGINAGTQAGAGKEIKQMLEGKT